MPCFKPLPARRKLDGTVKIYRRKKHVKYITPVVDTILKLMGQRNFFVPCGQCIGCRLERSRQWAVRCMHEAKLYEKNCFITLTYDNENLPKDKSLKKKHFQDFMKRLRKRFGANIRFFHCGEYGDKYHRPHYHACIFNHDFEDKVLFKIDRGNKLFTSQALSELWPFGFASIGEVTFQSAAYVARYIMKKVTGKKAEEYYANIDLSTGEYLGQRTPEYTTMSRRPGIGKGFYDIFKSDWYPSDFCVVNNKKIRPPKYYDRQYEIEYPDDYLALKNKRIANSQKYANNNSSERLEVREKIQEIKLKQLKRGLDHVT